MSGFDLSNFLAAFFDEARDRLVSINRGLVEFESETIDEEGLVTLRRDAHTIKGSALMLGVVDVGAVAHLFEDAMEHLIQHPELRVPKMTQFLYDLHDALDERLEEVDTEPRLDSKSLKVQYEALLKSVQTGSSETPEAKVDDGYSMIGAEEAASWKKQNDDRAEAEDIVAATAIREDAAISDRVDPLPIAAVTTTPEVIKPVDTQPDIDAMMPDGMFIEDSMSELLTDPTALEDTGNSDDFSIDDAIVLTEDDSDDIVELEDLDDVFTLGELDDGLDESSLEALLGDIDTDDGLFVYGDSEKLNEAITDEEALAAESAEQARQQAEAAAEEARQQAQLAAEQARIQAEAVATELARQQAEAAAELVRQQAEAAAAEQARQQAEAAAAEQARQQAEAAAAEQARQQAEAAAATQARQQAEAAAAEQARQQAEIAAAAQARQQAEAAAAEQARQQAEAAAAEQARQQAEAAAAEQARQQAEIAAAEQVRQQAEAAAAEQARQQAEAAAAEQARQQAEAAAAEQARQQAEVSAAEQAPQQHESAAAKQAAADREAKALRKREREARSIVTKAKLVETEKAAQLATAAAAEKMLKQAAPKGDSHRFRPENVDGGGSSRSSGQRQSSGRFLRVDAARLEELSSFVVELSTERSRGEEVEVEFRGLLHEFRDLRLEWRALQRGMSEEMNAEDQARLMDKMDRSFDQGMRKMSRFMENQRFSQMRGAMMLKELRDQVLSLMLRPLDNIFSTFPRAVRDVAVKLDKRVKLVVDGSSVEIDQGISESLVEPLVHLLNNSVSHGIELPDERERLGKPKIAQVSIVARQSGSEIHIEVIDDGRGLDVDLIKSTAVERGVTTQVEADQMDSAEILEMIFRPGFSTKKNVSDVSGRGIGMNVVQDAVRRLTGSIRIDSELGKGTRFLLSLPVSIAVQHALTFRMGGAYFGMLTHLVEQIVPLSAQPVEKGTGGKDFIRYNNTLVALVDMRAMMTEDDECNLSSRPYVIIAEHIEGFVGVVVDEMLDELEIVVRDLDPYIKRYQPQGLMGTTIAADGSVLILLEPYGIKEMGRTAPDQAIDINITEEEKMSNTVLLVEDSLIARQIEKSVFESIGFTVETAIDGLDGLEKLKKGSFDLVVTDLEMPRLDGFGFVRRIRNQPEYEELPIMVISTRESAEDRMRALEAGADAYMIKQQLQGDKILETVQALIGSTEAA